MKRRGLKSDKKQWALLCNVHTNVTDYLSCIDRCSAFRSNFCKYCVLFLSTFSRKGILLKSVKLHEITKQEHEPLRQL